MMRRLLLLIVLMTTGANAVAMTASAVPHRAKTYSYDVASNSFAPKDDAHSHGFVTAESRFVAATCEVLSGRSEMIAADTADAGASTVGRDAAKSCLTNSFTADTPVTLANGKQEPISKVKVGDKVLATDPETGETKAEPVEQLIRHSGQHAMVLVTLADGSVLDSTDGHPIWDATTGQFTTAADLHVGDKIETSGGQLIAISGLTGYSANLTAYNLQISQIHTYYAGSTPVLVHNSCNVPSDSDLGQVISRGGRTSTDQQAIFRQLEQQHGLDLRVASERLHAIKSGVENNRDVIFTRSGSVYDSTSGDHLGDLLQG